MVDYVNVNVNACVACKPCVRDMQNVCARTIVSTVLNARTLPGEHDFFFEFKNFSSGKKAPNISLEFHDEVKFYL